MRYRALLTDYDGTLASHGRVEPSTVAALRRLRESGVRIVVVTGREVEDLLEVFPEAQACDRIVAENGGLLVRPATREIRMLAHAPSARFVAALRVRAIAPLSVGRVLVATRAANEGAVRSVIRELDLPLVVSRNLDALMVLPRGVHKGRGARAALRELGIEPTLSVAIGDAQNDEPLLRAGGLAVAVSSALERVKRRAALVTRGGAGEGVRELTERILADDL
jgi:hydroxymethylpyrimidine pyrophosphatase-like HAD family hydrolase